MNYTEHDISFQNNKAKITFAGTLSIPQGEGIFPVAYLIPGMGAMDRDATFAGRKPFKILADFLTQQGIAVLRVDKRGVGKSTGVYDTSVTAQDLADDALAGIQFLKTVNQIDPQQIILVGHSEGGLVAIKIASETHDVAGLVLMAGAVANSVEDLVKQTAVQLKMDGASVHMIESDKTIRAKLLEIVKNESDKAKAEHALRETFAHYWQTLPEEQKKESDTLLFAFSQTKFESQVAFLNSPYYRYMLNYDAQKALEHIRVPLLALYGSLDFMAPSIVFPIIETALKKAGNKDFQLLKMPRLNHALLPCETGSIAEYATITQNMSVRALVAIAGWICDRFAQKNA